ncbi:hypothetical protein J7E83_19020 [Arthrobacter sp. ISL-48]|uniref:hypothetical protein n=1 Tax=Arthrobacter sp. ISL-48 TaxID=2819110 RepID=UPI001BEBC281|nr:hypothetical protein [Arthrobacter sp. ISL-48]MBT2534178.1 hypothetical protein [Arthrobacter sp. ISL-48]
MSSISARRCGPGTAGSLGQGGDGGIDVPLLQEQLQELAARYVAYREALSGPFDPIRTLGLTGDILASVRHILAATGHDAEDCPVNNGKALQ